MDSCWGTTIGDGIGTAAIAFAIAAYYIAKMYFAYKSKKDGGA